MEYAINSILRQKGKNIFIFIVFTLLVTILSAVFFVSGSIKYELNQTLNQMPSIVVQNIKGGRVVEVDESLGDEFLEIEGVSSVVGRVWGYYHFIPADVDFTIIGIDEFEKQYSSIFEKYSQKLDENSMIVGDGVKKILNRYYYNEYFNFIKYNATIKKIKIGTTFSKDTKFQTDDVMLMSKDNAREIFNIDSNKVVDFAINVANKNEILTVVSKIKLILPTARVITKDDLAIEYEKLFNYKGGLFLALFLISTFTFFIIVYDKVSSISSEEKREIGVLKAIGWRVEDILKEKFYEASVISFLAYFLGVSIALSYVYIFNAPLIRDIFVGSSNLKTDLNLMFVFDTQTLFLVFFLSVPIYIASIIVPAWRVATLDADELIR